MSYYTIEGYEKLEREIESISDEYKETTLAMGASDAIDSDLRENPEFMQLRMKAMYGLPKKKQMLLLEQKKAIIIEETDEYKNWNGRTIIRKCDVELSIGPMEVRYRILGCNESDLGNHILSCEAPLVLALLGHEIGETVEFNGMSIFIKNVMEIEKDFEKTRK